MPTTSAWPSMVRERVWSELEGREGEGEVWRGVEGCGGREGLGYGVWLVR